MAHTLFFNRPVNAGRLLSIGLQNLCCAFMVFSPLVYAFRLPQHPNILLIVLDDANKDISIYGGPAQTPNLERIARGGIVFTNAVANSTGCNPSRVSFATGLLPVNNCVHSMEEVNDKGTVMTEWRQYMDECPVATQHYGENAGSRVKTLFRTFSDNGYYTFAAGKVMHLNGQQWPEFDQNIWTPIDHLQRRATNIPLHGLHRLYAVTSKLADWGALEDLVGANDETFSEQDTADWTIVDDFIRLLSRAPADQPFFAAVGLVSPHVPRYVPRRLIDRYDNVQLPEVLWNDADDLPSTGRYLNVEHPVQQVVDEELLADEAHWRFLVQTYYASLTFGDEQIGRILNALDSAGHLHDTVIVVWSDHGYHLGQKLKIEKGSLWRESYEIPLIIKAPGYGQASISAHVNSVDLFPTLMELVNITQTDDLPRDGVSLTTLMRDPQAVSPGISDRPALVFYHGHAVIHTDEYTYIAYNVLNDEELQHELYAIQTDIHQWDNRADNPDMQGVLLEMQNRLAPYLVNWQ